MYKKIRTLIDIFSFIAIAIPVGIIAYIEEKFVYTDSVRNNIPEHVKYSERNRR